MYLFPDSKVHDYALKHRRLLIPFSIVHNAVPASKILSSDLPEALTISAEGQTAAAAALDSGCNFATAADATGIFGLLVTNVGKVGKLLDVSLVNLSSGTAVVSRSGASSSGVTASQNIAVSVDSSLSLAATDLSATLVIDLELQK